MNTQKLIEKYNAGQLSIKEQMLLESMIERGEVSIEQLNQLQELQNTVNKMEAPDPSVEMSSGFYQQLAAAKSALKPTEKENWFANLWIARPTLRWAYSIGLLAIGLGAGFLLNTRDSENDQLEELSAQVSDMKELLMLTLLEKDSPSDRLKAVNLTSEITDVSTKVTEALLKTLNNDPNINVRLAALESLYPYASNPKVREGLIKSVSGQESPLVQLAMAEMMATLQEKRSVNGLKQLLEDENTPIEVRERIEESIAVLI